MANNYLKVIIDEKQKLALEEMLPCGFEIKPNRHSEDRHTLYEFPAQTPEQARAIVEYAKNLGGQNVCYIPSSQQCSWKQYDERILKAVKLNIGILRKPINI